jgi:hypothetical protein
MAEGYSYLLEWFKSPIVSAVANLLLMIATIFLARYTKGLFEATSAYGNFIQKQTEIMKDQASANEVQTENLKRQTEIMRDNLEYAKEQTINLIHQSEIMDKQIKLAEGQNEIIQAQVSSLREQNKMLKEQFEYNIKIIKYTRLKDEMEKLIMPLNYAAKTDKLKDGSFFSKYIFHPKNIANPNFEQKTFLWDGVKKHLYLCSSENLLMRLSQFFEGMNVYLNESSDEKEEYIKNATRNLIEEINIRYPQLRSEISELEKELGIRQK